MSCSNNILTVTLNALILVFSVPILITGIWLRQNAATVCDGLVEKQLIILGVFLLAFSIVGIIGAFFGLRWLLWVYYFVMVLAVLILLGSISFVFVVTYKGYGEDLNGKEYKEYRVQSYSFYLQKRVYDWNTVRRCLVDGDACGSLIRHSNTTATQFYQEKLSPIESGCCKPSNDCGFKFVTPTNWTKPNATRTTLHYSNPDCALWSNNKSVLCYDCDACKAGVIQSIKNHWRKAAVINIGFVLIVFVLIVFVAACFAFASS